MLKSVELRLCLFGGPGRSSALSLSGAVVGGGREAECECDTRGSVLCIEGDGGFVTVVLGSGALHISHSLREAWLRKVQRGHCFFCSGVEGRGAGSS